MSLNKYNATTGELENIASGQRTWVGTRAAYDAAKQAGTLPTNALICITDDEEDYCHYSTEETKTGNYWIDGKPIYRKVVQVTISLPGNSWTNTGINISDVETLVNCSMLKEGFSFGGLYTRKDANYLYVYCLSDASWLINHVILEYTKNTD